MKDIFAPFSFGNMSLKNRFVRSATYEARADADGTLTEKIFPVYRALAEGGVGLIITGHMYVDADWKCGPKQIGITDEAHMAGLRRLAEVCRAADTRAVAQINYIGRAPDEMTETEIRSALDCFVAAGNRAREAGFDGVQIHAAHGFLLSRFLTPSENRRSDRYGHGPEGRRRLLLEIAAGLRRALGTQYPILCKLGTVDGRDDSLDLEETVATARALRSGGIDAIEVSSTLSGDHAQAAPKGIDSAEKEAVFASQARAVSQAVDIPVILVGGLRSVSVMQRAVDEGTCDMVSMCRPFIREPDLVKRFEAGELDRSSCVSCSGCYNPDGFRCVHVDPKGP